MLSRNDDIAKLFSQFQSGESTAIELGQRILELAVATQGSVTPDTDRKRRCGYPEVIYGLGKSPDAIRKVTEILFEANEEILVTRVSPEQVRTLSDWFDFQPCWKNASNRQAAGSDRPGRSLHSQGRPKTKIGSRGSG